MKFNPVTGRLYTNAGATIKALHCPEFRQWNELAIEAKDGTRHCTGCDRSIVDTQGLTDADVLLLIDRDASTCLKVNLSQDNIRVVNFDV